MIASAATNYEFGVRALFRLPTQPPSRSFVGCGGGLVRLAELLNQLEELIRSEHGNKLPRELAYRLVVLEVNPVVHAAHETHSVSRKQTPLLVGQNEAHHGTELAGAAFSFLDPPERVLAELF